MKNRPSARAQRNPGVLQQTSPNQKPEAGQPLPYAGSVSFDVDDDRDEYADFVPVRRSRAVRWTAVLIIASFAAAGLSSLLHWF